MNDIEPLAYLTDVLPHFPTHPNTADPAQRHPPDAGVGSRGRTKQSKTTNLLKRLRDYRQDVWRFMREDGVPFTNNLSEQALRMSKAKQKGNLCACLACVFERRTIQPCFAG